MRLASLLLCSVVLTTLQLVVATQPNRRPESSSLSRLSWKRRITRSHALRLPRDVSRQLRKRYVTLGDYQANQSFQPCLMPGGGRGSCRHLQYCILEDFRSSFPRFLDFLCVIERSFVGVCCPDRVDQGGFLPPSGNPALLPPTTLRLPGQGQPADEGQGQGQGQGQGNPDQGASGKLQTRGCGLSSRATRRTTETAEASDPKEWPWMAAIMRDEDVQFCGAVLITDRHVLTAAHCVAKYALRPELLRVRLGEYDFARPDETRWRDFDVAWVRAHADYRRATYENDVALLKLERPASFNSYVWSVCLPPPGESFENQTAIATGWGTVEFAGPVSDVLLEVQVPVWRQSRCEAAFSQPIFDTMMCAAGYQGGQDACQGDSGGPLMWQDPDGRWAVIGIVSWGIGCGEVGQPGVYIRVNKYLDWITANAEF